jgi:hypothetical protein
MALRSKSRVIRKGFPPASHDHHDQAAVEPTQPQSGTEDGAVIAIAPELGPAMAKPGPARKSAPECVVLRFPTTEPVPVTPPPPGPPLLGPFRSPWSTVYWRSPGSPPISAFGPPPAF